MQLKPSKTECFSRKASGKSGEKSYEKMSEKSAKIVGCFLRFCVTGRKAYSWEQIRIEIITSLRILDTE